MVDLEVTRTQIFVGVVLVPSARPRFLWFDVLDPELVTSRLWTPLELECCLPVDSIPLEKDSAIEGRRETDWSHRTRFGGHDRNGSIPT